MVIVAGTRTVLFSKADGWLCIMSCYSDVIDDSLILSNVS